MIKSFTLTLLALAAALLLAAAAPAARQSAPAPCSKVCRAPASVCGDRDAFIRALRQECTDDDNGVVRLCSKCNGRTTNFRDTLRNCMLLTVVPVVFGVPRGDVTVHADMDGVSVFDTAVNQGGLTWRGDIKNSLICKTSTDGEGINFIGDVENSNFPVGLNAAGEGTVKNPNPFFGPRFLISKAGISFTGETRNNRFGKIEAEGKITIREKFQGNRIKTMVARSGFSFADTVKGNKFGRVNALTPATAPDFESNFDVERIGFRGKFDDTVFTDNEARLLRIAGSCSADDGSVIERNTADRFRGDDKAGCGEVFDF